MSKYRIVIASHKPEILRQNLYPSKLYKETDAQDISIMRNYTNIPKAYNAAKRGSKLTIFMHHDVYLPDEFSDQVQAAIDEIPNDWGVLGVAGATSSGKTRHLFGHVLDRGTVWGKPFDKPLMVQTLDELILIVNSELSMIKFDEQFEQDFYGADICTQALELGFRNYVIPAFCHHNSERVVGSKKPPTFYESEKKFKLKWKYRLPLSTTCSIMLP